MGRMEGLVSVDGVVTDLVDVCYMCGDVVFETENLFQENWRYFGSLEFGNGG